MQDPDTTGQQQDNKQDENEHEQDRRGREKHHPGSAKRLGKPGGGIVGKQRRKQGQTHMQNTKATTKRTARKAEAKHWRAKKWTGLD